MSECNSYAYDSQLGYMPSVPLPYYCWEFWRWQKVRCHCGQTFITRDLSLTPVEYSRHYILNHVEPSDEENKMDWIKCSERLPKKSGDVQIAGHAWTYENGHKVLSVEAAFFNQHTRLFWVPENEGDTKRDAAAATYWRPLSDPPVEVPAPAGKGPTSDPSQP